MHIMELGLVENSQLMYLGSFQIRNWIPGFGARIHPSSVYEFCLEWVRLMEGHCMLVSTFIRDLVGGRGYMLLGICKFLHTR